MKKAERDELRRVAAAVQAGDRERALLMLRSMVQVAVYTGCSSQMYLPIILIQTFRCDRLNANAMRVKDCLDRRSRIWPSGNAKGAPTEQSQVCQGCGIGAYFAERLPMYEPPPSAIPRAAGGRRTDAP